MDNNEEVSVGLEEILLRKIRHKDIPILKAPDFGHNCPNTIFPIGVEVKLNSENKEIKVVNDFLL